ncbi:MAG: 16S rRNA (cytidine(1402)-2'-O)-methyltransferase [Candidatus Omnitrophica bacterium]|jgi:16S rRNA (cytidine1402-2'-O)-methyltransferase|nr:16S rRNA (cytidine(1402)-2'-O)-methyltransferase [Candidatus Omnitrophota bacterium]
MLYLVATPIGNLGDITLRALEVLKAVDFILSEDTRKTGQLLRHFGINKKPISFYAYNEIKKTSWVIEELKKNKNIALVSNAGTPAISDPGHYLIKKCLEEKVSFSVVPGPSAVVTALLLSGLSSDKFLFLGFLPRKKGKKNKVLREAFLAKSTIIIFESPHRLVNTLIQLQEITGDREVVLVREMTKIYEETIRGKISEVKASLEAKTPKGEFVMVIDNN